MLNQLIYQLHSSKILDKHMSIILERFRYSNKSHQPMSRLQKLQRMVTLLSKNLASKLFLMKEIWLKLVFSKTLFTTKVIMHVPLIIQKTAKIHSTMFHTENGLVRVLKSNLSSKLIPSQKKHLLPHKINLLHFNQLLVKLSNLPKSHQKSSQDLAQSSQLVW